MKQYIPLGSVISKATVEKCGSRQLPILSITMKDGLVLQDEKFKKRIASADTTDYKVIPRGKLVQGIHIDEANFGIQDIVDEGIVSPAYKVWEVDSSIIFPKYLEMIMRSPRSLSFYRSKLNGSVNRRGRMTDADFLAMPIPFVGYEQQEKIVSIIRQTSSIIALYSRQLLALDTLTKARFVEMFGDPKENKFGYPVKPLGELVSDIIPGWSANGENRKKVGNEKAVLKVSAVTQGFFLPEEHKALPVDLEIKKYIFPHKGDLLFSRANTRELVGATAIIEEDYPNLLLPDKLWRVLFIDEVSVYYAKYVLSTESIRREFSAQSNGTSGSMFNVSAEKFRNISIPIPPISLQNAFETFIHQINKSKAVVQKALDVAQLLFDSLMQQYFG